jgi:hypothetical protein
MAISDWDHRQLCPDGACVGVIGPDGTCKTCGRVAPDWGDERRRGLVATDDGGKDGEEAKDGGEEDEISPSAPALIGEAAVWHRRQLCPDGACVGLLGPDGTCKVCGKSATGAAEEEEEEEEGSEAEGGEDEGGEDEGGEDEGGKEEEASDEEAEDEEEDKDGEDEAKGEDEGDSDLGDRKLCPDGACIGVIGPDNRCKVCGKEAA